MFHTIGASQFTTSSEKLIGPKQTIITNEPADFYNWNRVFVRYCDGASFSGDNEMQVPKLYFRGKRIWRAAVEDLLAKGMSNVEQALLSGCSAGGLSSILHCDNFRMILPKSANVKCLSDAGLFLDTKDVSGVYRMRSFFNGTVTMQGGGWCNDVSSCLNRITNHRGSSQFMEKKSEFSGILSNKKWENPDFYNWNRTLLRYCDGASFSGDSEIQAPELYFRGQRIWRAAIEHLLGKGMDKVEQALLSGSSAGGLASILHCDNFRHLLPKIADVKCLSDAGFFLDTKDVSGAFYLRSLFHGTVTLQGVAKNLPSACTSDMDPTKVPNTLESVSLAIPLTMILFDMYH